MNINYKPLPANQYNADNTKKEIIILHHTAGRTIDDALNYWKQNADKVATHFIIGRDGEVVQCIPDEKWAYALGIKTATFPFRLQWEGAAFQIELCALGFLTEKGGKFYAYTGDEIPESEISHINYRGYKAYHKYTDAQLNSLRELLQHLSQKFNIPLLVGDIGKFCDNLIDEISKYFPSQVRVQGKTIFTHTNFRADKTDCFPQPELLAMLQSLNNVNVQEQNQTQTPPKKKTQKR